MPAKQRKSDKRRPSQSEENELGMSEGGKPGRDAMVEVDGGEGTEAPNEVGAQSSQPSALPKSEGDEDTGDGAEASEANAKLQELKAKAASGKKLSNKERRLLQKYQEMADLQKETAQAEAALEENPYGEFLKNFSVILRGQNANAESGAHAQCLKADRFSISGKTKPLFTDASFSLSAGRRYGLVGPNGEGKSVLMKHIAAGVFPLPPGWDVLYVGQEVPASSETVADAVLSADRRRALILREEARLMEEMEGEGSAQWSDAMWEEKVKRLQELGDEAEALDAHGAEARVRIVLSGLGFKPEEADLPVSRFSGGWA
uniref:ABC transporter domain-containing protein n=1 Tax=Chromera velia CCMP2878 TaxID=1169474 RepID=A0A0G4HXD5_9ALVE|eukprot:Cvel_33096.t1-p1 / transcript=Cvel_33096.t1 / gene=Cvel_33096 / organism=Chromera_velia_CCMP2878 / gene_product=ATP-binding cassette sub-family F member 1, putative / transcript_product=ATP-binding cassette sub-family F member 1, putative / location=Cvel_scaffold5290:4447-5823(+) / protein_length=316 / sequence_SO=supercontig / SO=protein_coding / is_pseudo=false